MGDELFKDISKWAKKKYRLKKGQKFDPNFDKNKELLAGQLLIEEMESKDATEEELLHVYTYMVIAANAKKDRLDYMRAYADLNIDNYISKYIDFEMKGNLKNEE